VPATTTATEVATTAAGATAAVTTTWALSSEVLPSEPSMIDGSDSYIDDRHHIHTTNSLITIVVNMVNIFMTATTIIIITYIITRSKFKTCTQPVRYLSEYFGCKPQRREISTGIFTACSSLWQMCMSDDPIALLVVAIDVAVVVVGCAAAAPTIIPSNCNGWGFATKAWRVDNTHKHRLALDHPLGRPPPSTLLPTRTTRTRISHTTPTKNSNSHGSNSDNSGSNSRRNNGSSDGSNSSDSGNSSESSNNCDSNYHRQQGGSLLKTKTSKVGEEGTGCFCSTGITVAIVKPGSLKVPACGDA
jgi:uncharacterized membrane protein YgcG